MLSKFIIFSSMVLILSLRSAYAGNVLKINPYYDSSKIKNIFAKDYPRFIKINEQNGLKLKKHMTKEQKAELEKKIYDKYHIDIFKFISAIDEAKKNKEAQAQIKLSARYFKERKPEIKKFENDILYQNHVMVSQLLHQGSVSGQIFTNQYIYIFMSSSVPISIWRTYAKEINKMKQNHIIMVLRGCIGGCKSIMPTDKFISKVLKGKGKKLIAPIVLDPYLFRYYGVKRVPEFVFARNVNLINPTVTAGVSVNLKNKPISYSVLGAWSFNYVLARLYKKSKDRKLIELSNILNKSWFYGR